jgi:hypothetical protein
VAAALGFNTGEEAALWRLSSNNGSPEGRGSLALACLKGAAVWKGSHRARRRWRLSLLEGGTMGKGRGAWFTASGGGRGGGPDGAGVTRGGGGLVQTACGRAVAGAGQQWRAQVGWHSAWEQRRRGVRAYGSRSASVGRPEGIVSFVNDSKIFKQV